MTYPIDNECHGDEDFIKEAEYERHMAKLDDLADRMKEMGIDLDEPEELE